MHIFRNFPILRILSASLLVPVTFGTVRVCLKMWYPKFQWVTIVFPCFPHYNGQGHLKILKRNIVQKLGAPLKPKMKGLHQDASLSCSAGRCRRHNGTIALSRLPFIVNVLLVAGVDPKRIAAIGYCFGGRTVLDLARHMLRSFL